MKNKAADLLGQPLPGISERLLGVLFLWIALLAGLAVFGGFDAAGVFARLASGLCLIAAGFRTDGNGGEHREGASNGDE